MSRAPTLPYSCCIQNSPILLPQPSWYVGVGRVVVVSEILLREKNVKKMEDLIVKNRVPGNEVTVPVLEV